jgi:hypothetical protein
MGILKSFNKGWDMKKKLTAAACLFFLVLLVHGLAFADQANTGDRKLDSLLVKIDERAEADPDGFILQLSEKHRIPEVEIRQAKDLHSLSFGDLYMATGLALRLNRPVRDVAAEYRQNQGRGWGVLAMSMGIKPGSPAFKQLKANARGSVKHLKARAKASKRDRKFKGESQGNSQGKRKKK